MNKPVLVMSPSCIPPPVTSMYTHTGHCVTTWQPIGEGLKCVKPEHKGDNKAQSPNTVHTYTVCIQCIILLRGFS